MSDATHPDDGATPEDYTQADGYDDDAGLEMCPHCERIIHPGGVGDYWGPVHDRAGARYETVLAAEPGGGPYFCPPCHRELVAELHRQNNVRLARFGGGE